MKRVLTLMLALILCLSCFAACTEIEQKPDETETKANEEETLTTEQALKNAVAYVKDMYKQFLKTPETPIDYNLVSAVKVGGVDYTVTWTVDNEAIKVVSGEGEVTIDVPEKAEADIAYKLTATVVAADGTKSEPLVFELTVPAFKVNTIEEYYAAKKDDLVVFEGIVTGIVSTTNGATNKCIFLQDKGGKGGCYVYGMTEDPIADLGIEIGMTVRAAGAKDIYNGTHELKPTGIEIISKEKTDVTPIDLTEAFTAAADLKAESLIGVQGALVTIKGVEITGQEESSGYYKFKLGELETYVRISGSTCAISKDDQSTFKATHTEKRGFKADVTGIVSIYSGTFYLVPVTVDAFSGFQEITRTDAEKVEYEAANITVVPEEIKLDGATVDLPLKGATYQDVVITWTSDKAWATIDETGKLTVRLQAAEETLKLTATVTLGENTKTVEFTVKVAKKPTVVPQVVDTPAANTAYKFFLTQENNGEILYLNGEMKDYYFATTTNHEEAVDVYLETVDGGYKFYFMKGDVKTYISVVRVESNGSMHNNVVFNAETPSVWTWNEENKTLTTVIDVDGTATTFYLGTYNTFSTISASKIDKAATSFVCHLATMVDTSSISDADKVAAEKEALNVTTTIDTELALPATGTTYTDVVITWTAEDKAGAAIADGKLTVVPTATEQTLKLTATIKSGEVTDTKEFTITVRKVLATEADIVNAAYELKPNETLGEFTLTGVITKVNTAWSDEYKNITVTIVVANLTDKPIEVYRLKGEGAKDLSVGDTITVKGTLKNFRNDEKDPNGAGKVEFDTGCTLDKVSQHSHTYNTFANKCDICGAIKEHTCVDTTPADGKCDLCEATVAAPGSTLASVDIKSYAEANKWTIGGDKPTKATSITIDDNITVTIAGGNNSGKIYEEGLRLYASDTPAGSITITAAEGKKIKSVKITTVTGTYAFLQVNGNTAEDLSNTEVEVNASSITFNTVKNGDKGKQSRISMIEVVYE